MLSVGVSKVRLFLNLSRHLEEPQPKLVSALDRAKFNEIKAEEELHPCCSPPSPQLSVRLLEETKSELSLEQREIHIKTPGKMSEYDSER